MNDDLIEKLRNFFDYKKDVMEFFDISREDVTKIDEILYILSLDIKNKFVQEIGKFMTGSLCLRDIIKETREKLKQIGLMNFYSFRIRKDNGIKWRHKKVEEKKIKVLETIEQNSGITVNKIGEILDMPKRTVSLYLHELLKTGKLRFEKISKASNSTRYWYLKEHNLSTISVDNSDT